MYDEDANHERDGFIFMQMLASTMQDTADQLAFPYTVNLTEPEGFGYSMTGPADDIISFCITVSAEGGLLKTAVCTADGLAGALESLKGFRGTMMIGPSPYDDEMRSLLGRWKGDWMLIQARPPVSASLQVKNMSRLLHDGMDLKTCKAHYDHLTLFRFIDTAERERVLNRTSGIPAKERSHIERSAGMTDVLSNRDGDIREVRTYLDMKLKADRMVRSSLPEVWVSDAGPEEKAEMLLSLIEKKYSVQTDDAMSGTDTE